MLHGVADLLSTILFVPDPFGRLLCNSVRNAELCSSSKFLAASSSQSKASKLTTSPAVSARQCVVEPLAPSLERVARAVPLVLCRGGRSMREARLPGASARVNIIENDRANADQRMHDPRENDEDYDQG